MRETKKVTAGQLKIGDKIVSFTINNCCTSSWRNCVKEINENGVVIYKKYSDDKGELISKDALFTVELSDEEFINKYHVAARYIYDILSGPEYKGDRGFHEMDNSWLGGTIEEFYVLLQKKKLSLIGWFSLPNIKHGFFCDCDIGIIAEDENGERFWCHDQKENIDFSCSEYLGFEKRK